MGVIGPCGPSSAIARRGCHVGQMLPRSMGPEVEAGRRCSRTNTGVTSTRSGQQLKQEHGASVAASLRDQYFQFTAVLFTSLGPKNGPMLAGAVCATSQHLFLPPGLLGPSCRMLEDVALASISWPVWSRRQQLAQKIPVHCWKLRQCDWGCGNSTLQQALSSRQAYAHLPAGILW